MRYWLTKSEAGSYGWTDLVRDGGTEWDGVRNAAAALHLKAMVPGDRVLFYHSGDEKAAVGLMEVSRAARPDGEERWVSVEVRPIAPLTRPVTLKAMKGDARLAGMAMLRQSRLSVSPVTGDEWAVLMELAEG